MPKTEQKQLIVQEIEEKLKKSALVVFTDCRGLSVEEITDLRNKLRAPGVEFKVYKNTMLRFAMEKLGQDPKAEYLTGPNTVMFSEEDMVGPAKTLFEFGKARKNKNFSIKAGVLEGKIISATEVTALAELPSREVLLSMVVGTMQAPIASFVRALQANITGFVRAIDQVREKKAS